MPADQKRVLVTGSRTYRDHQRIKTALHSAWILLGAPKDCVLVHGAADGADLIAAQTWAAAGLPTDPHPVTKRQWRDIGGYAGNLRNERMVRKGADICLAFPNDDSSGTLHCIREAQEAGIPTFVLPE